MAAQMNSRGQIAIFVIASIVIVAMIVLVLIARGGPNIPLPGGAFSPESYLSSCVRDAVEEEGEIMMRQGGFVEPRDYLLFNEDKITYVCKNVNYYEPCINQYPRYIEAVRVEMENNVKERADSCLETLDAELERQNYKVDREQNAEITVELIQDSVVVDSFVDMTLTKGETTQTFDKLTARVRMPIYNLVTVANEIVRQESEFCYFSNDGFSLIYPEFDIRRDVRQDGTKIYTIKHVPSDKEMKVAVRGCVVPQGIG